MKAKGWHCLLGAFLAIIISLAVWAYFTGEIWTALITPIVLAVAAVIAYRQLEHARHARCAELLLDIMKWWNSDEMLEGRLLLWTMKNAKDEILELYKAKNEKFLQVMKVGQFGESLGVLIFRKYIDVKDIWLLFEDIWERIYQHFTGFLDELKEKNPQDTTFCNLKLLCEELNKITVKEAEPS